MRPRVVLLSAPGALAGLEATLEVSGIDLVTYPLLAFDDPADWGPFDRALDRLDRYLAIAVTSPRASAAFVRRLAERGGPVASLPPVWATGPATAAAFRAIGVACAMGTARYQVTGAAAQLARAMIAAGVRGPVLFPCGAQRRAELVEILVGAGVPVDEVVCYVTNPARPGRVSEVLAGASLLVVTSPSAALALDATLGGAWPPAPVITIGATTLAEAHRLGWPEVDAAPESTVPGVAGCIEAVLATSDPGRGGL